MPDLFNVPGVIGHRGKDDDDPPPFNNYQQFVRRMERFLRVMTESEETLQEKVRVMEDRVYDVMESNKKKISEHELEKSERRTGDRMEEKLTAIRSQLMKAQNEANLKLAAFKADLEPI